MRKYNREHQLLQVTCNKCGKTTETENFILKEDYFTCEKSWGYFSNRDGEVDRWDLCENCYNEMVKGFKVAIETHDKTELMND